MYFKLLRVILPKIMLVPFTGNSNYFEIFHELAVNNNLCADSQTCRARQAQFVSAMYDLPSSSSPFSPHRCRSFLPYFPLLGHNVPAVDKGI
jgi:hypothetical protein